eukprot:383297_1
MASLTRMICLCCLINYNSASVTCHSPYECNGQTLTSIDPDRQRVGAYKGAIGANTSFDGWKLDCTASFSCYAMASITQDSNDDGLTCRGRSSCSNTTHIQCTNSNIDCDGSNACSHSNITLNDDSKLSCRGYSSCSNTNIRVHSSNTIEAFGSFSLYEAIIDTISDFSGTLTLYLRGKLTAFGAQLRCEIDHVCEVYCETYDACHMFYIECAGQCNVHTLFGTEIRPIISNRSSSPTMTAFFASQALIPYNDALCGVDKWSFDNYEEHMHGTAVLVNSTSAGPICCRGHLSCSNVTLEFETEINNDLICDGYTSCQDSVIVSNNGGVYCEAQSGCKKAVINGANDVYCLGAWGCRDAIITNARYVICGGYLGCVQVIFFSGGTGSNFSVFFVGNAAGKDSTMYCNETDVCHIHCDGEDACERTTLNCVHNCDVVCTNTAICPEVIDEPTMDPSPNPTDHPTHTTMNPSKDTTIDPSKDPTFNPTNDPIFTPSRHPTLYLTHDPTINPSNGPTGTSYTYFPTIYRTHDAPWFSTIRSRGEQTETMDTSTTLAEFEPPYIPRSKNEYIAVILIIVIVLLVVCTVVGLIRKFLNKAKGAVVIPTQLQKMQSTSVVELNNTGVDGSNQINTEIKTQNIEPAIDENEFKTDGWNSIHMKPNALPFTGEGERNVHLNQDNEGITHDNRVIIEYNMDHEGDEVVLGNNAATKGKDDVQDNGDGEIIYNMNAEKDDVVIGDDDCEQVTDGGLVNSGRCTDCGQIKHGKVYEGDGLFYCDRCYGCYATIM